MNRPAALTVCAHATTPDEARELLAMLGIHPAGDTFNTSIILTNTSPKITEGRRATEETKLRQAKPRGTTERDYKPCGTTAAYRRHLRLTEPPCPACRAAAARDRLERKLRTR